MDQPIHPPSYPSTHPPTPSTHPSTHNSHSTRPQRPLLFYCFLPWWLKNMKTYVFYFQSKLSQLYVLKLMYLRFCQNWYTMYLFPSKLAFAYFVKTVFPLLLHQNCLAVFFFEIKIISIFFLKIKAVSLFFPSKLISLFCFKRNWLFLLYKKIYIYRSFLI